MISDKATLFEIKVTNDSFKFNAAHFVAFSGFRERLHGHNYRISVRLCGSRKIGGDGYVIDFGDVKAAVRAVCKRLNEHFLCPSFSDVLQISTFNDNSKGFTSVKLVCEDGAVFVFPRDDVAMLPIVHATAEELAIYCWGEILSQLDAMFLFKRGVHAMEVTCAEAVGQEAVFRMDIPDSNEPDVIHQLCDVRRYITAGDVAPKPCPLKENYPSTEAVTAAATVEHPNMARNECSDGCSTCRMSFSKRLQALASAINSGTLKSSPEKPVHVEDLEDLMTAVKL